MARCADLSWWLLIWGMSLYVIWVTNFFKTRCSINSPWNFTAHYGTLWNHHQKDSKIFECQDRKLNRICFMGKLAGLGIALWIQVYALIIALRPGSPLAHKANSFNALIWLGVFAGGFTLNWNFFAYLLPVALIQPHLMS